MHKKPKSTYILVKQRGPWPVVGKQRKMRHNVEHRNRTMQKHEVCILKHAVIESLPSYPSDESK